MTNSKWNLSSIIVIACDIRLNVIKALEMLLWSITVSFYIL